MKNLDLLPLGIQEMNAIEQTGTNGGNPLGGFLKGLGPVGALIAAGLWVYDNWDDIEEGWNSYEPKYIGHE